MHDIMNWIFELMRAHGPMSVFVGVIIESIIVPIPSPLIIMGAGALLLDPGLPWPRMIADLGMRVVLPGATASTIGAFMIYSIAFFGGKPIIQRYRRFLGFDWDDVLTMEKRLVKREVSMIFLLRAIPIIPLSLISGAVGALRMPVWPFIWATLAGSIPRCYILGVLGYLTRDSYEGLAGRVNKIESIISAVIVAAVFGVILYVRHHLRKQSKR
jgi:membrane protein DedA with SNARE-associated domain